MPDRWHTVLAAQYSNAGHTLLSAAGRLSTTHLLLQQLLFPADVTTIALGQHILPIGGNGLTGNHLVANARLHSIAQHNI